VAEVIRKFGERYARLQHVSGDSLRILRDLVQCRTAALGGHKRVCDHCRHEEISYNSCRNRHCPKCQAQARARWVDRRTKDLLEVPYFHVVFTLPDAFAPLVMRNPRRLYGILFRATAQTLLTIGRDPKHLGAEIGFLAVLHTWNQKLQLHPHLHCVVAGGGLAPEKDRWVACRSERFFLPVRVLSAVFRGKFLAHLDRDFRHGRIRLPDALATLEDPQEWSSWLQQQRHRKWVVYAKPPFGGPTQVLKYLARYTHRVAIDNSRLLSIDEETVVFRWKDRAHQHRPRTLRLPGPEFLRRFLLHKLPSGFMRIRYYGFLANRNRATSLPLIRQLLHTTPCEQQISENAALSSSPGQPWMCPQCHRGSLRCVQHLQPTTTLSRSPPWDVSLQTEAA
jgi:hypothetical protein